MSMPRKLLEQKRERLCRQADALPAGHPQLAKLVAIIARLNVALQAK